MTRIPLAVALCAAITGTVALGAAATPGGPAPAPVAAAAGSAVSAG
jgi:hypothetical protein